MPDYDQKILEELIRTNRLLADIAADLNWFKQRELNKAEHLRRTAAQMAASIPRMPKIGE